jgi:hypothetical protein
MVLSRHLALALFAWYSHVQWLARVSCYYRHGWLALLIWFSPSTVARSRPVVLSDALARSIEVELSPHVARSVKLVLSHCMARS